MVLAADPHPGWELKTRTKEALVMPLQMTSREAEGCGAVALAERETSFGAVASHIKAFTIW